MVGATTKDDRLVDADDADSDVGTMTLEDDMESVDSGESDGEAGTEALGSVAIDDGMLVAKDSPLTDAVETIDVAITDDVGKESVIVAAMNAVTLCSSAVATSVDTAIGTDLVAWCSSHSAPARGPYMISSSCNTASWIARTRVASVEP